MPAKKSQTRKRTPQKRKRSNGNPYAAVSGVLCIAAVIVVVIAVCLALSTKTEKDDTASVSDAGGVSEPERSEPENSRPSVIEIPTVSEVSKDPPKPPMTDEPLVQLASTQAYENQVGICYSVDLKEYEAYIDPADALEYVFVVSPTHTLDADFKPNDLVWIADMKQGRPEGWSYLRKYAEKALEAFLAESRVCGNFKQVGVSNGYRSYASQKSLFEGYIADEKRSHPDWTEEQVIALVKTYSNPPGTSEHQSGLCVDMHNQGSTDLTFANTPAALWLEENCYRFGFILRYPEDKQDITGIMFEPWHFRFVGRTAATEMHELGMCLEEYCIYKGIDPAIAEPEAD